VDLQRVTRHNEVRRLELVCLLHDEIKNEMDTFEKFGVVVLDQLLVAQVFENGAKGLAQGCARRATNKSAGQAGRSTVSQTCRQPCLCVCPESLCNRWAKALRKNGQTGGGQAASKGQRHRGHSCPLLLVGSSERVVDAWYSTDGRRLSDIAMGASSQSGGLLLRWRTAKNCPWRKACGTARNE
jgi:hypothetical protein